MTNSPLRSNCPPLPTIPGYNDDAAAAPAEESPRGRRARKQTLPACPQALHKLNAEAGTWA